MAALYSHDLSTCNYGKLAEHWHIIVPTSPPSAQYEGIAGPSLTPWPSCHGTSPGEPPSPFIIISHFCLITFFTRYRDLLQFTRSEFTFLQFNPFLAEVSLIFI